VNRAACPVRRLLRAQHTGKSFPDRVRMSSEPEANPPSDWCSLPKRSLCPTDGFPATTWWTAVVPTRERLAGQGKPGQASRERDQLRAPRNSPMPLRSQRRYLPCAWRWSRPFSAFRSDESARTGFLVRKPVAAPSRGAGSRGLPRRDIGCVSRAFAEGHFAGSQAGLGPRETPASERRRDGGPQGSRTPDLRRANRTASSPITASYCR